MPCLDGREEEDRKQSAKELKILKLNYAFLEAALCGTLKALEVAHAGYRGNDPLNIIDFEEAGILREDLEKWRAEHNAKDKQRKEEEDEDEELNS